MTPEEQYDKALAELDVKPGDVVEVVEKIPSWEGGWDNTWIDDMDLCIGERHSVGEIREGRVGIELRLPYMSNYAFPPQALKKVEK